MPSWAAVLDLVRAISARRVEPAHRLLLGRLVMYTGIAALFPVVPLYVRAHGGSAADVALFVAGPMVAATLVQIPAGHLVDRVGRKPILVWSTVVYAALCGGLFLNWGPLWLLAVWRAGQGAAGGAYGPEGGLLATGAILAVTVYLAFTKSIYTSEEMKALVFAPVESSWPDPPITIFSAPPEEQAKRD